MIVTKELLESLQKAVQVGKKKQDLEYLIRALDERTRLILQECHYDPNDSHRNTISLMGSSGKTLSNELLELQNQHDEYPESALPLMLDAVFENFTSRIRDDFGTFPNELFYTGSLHFTISFSLFGSYNSCTMSPKECKKEMENILSALKEKGFVIKERESEGWSLLGSKTFPYGENKSAFEAYFANLGIDDLQYEIFDDCILKVKGYIHVKDYTWYVKSEEVAEPVSDVLTENDVYHLNKTIKDFIFTLPSYSFMKQYKEEQISLGLIESYMHTIEKITGCHEAIFVEMEQRLEKTRRENLSARELQSEMGQELFQKHREQVSRYFLALEDRVLKWGKSIGLHIGDFTIRNYGNISFYISGNILRYKRKKLMPELAVDQTEQSHEYCIYNTAENVQILLNAVNQWLPHAFVQEWSVTQDNYIRKISIQTTSFFDPLILCKTLPLSERQNKTE